MSPPEARTLAPPPPWAQAPAAAAGARSQKTGGRTGDRHKPQAAAAAHGAAAQPVGRLPVSRPDRFAAWPGSRADCLCSGVGSPGARGSPRTDLALYRQTLRDCQSVRQRHPVADRRPHNARGRRSARFKPSNQLPCTSAAPTLCSSCRVRSTGRAAGGAGGRRLGRVALCVAWGRAFPRHPGAGMPLSAPPPIPARRPFALAGEEVAPA